MKKFALAAALFALVAACHKQPTQCATAADSDALELPGDATPAALPEDASPAADSTATAD